MDFVFLFYLFFFKLNNQNLYRNENEGKDVQMNDDSEEPNLKPDGKTQDAVDCKRKVADFKSLLVYEAL